MRSRSARTFRVSKDANVGKEEDKRGFDFDFLMTSLRARQADDIRSPELRGLFLIPRGSLDEIVTAGRTRVTLFSPDSTPRNHALRTRRERLSRFFIDLSDGADRSLALMRVIEIIGEASEE